jgi:hypothetical protein
MSTVFISLLEGLKREILPFHSETHIEQKREVECNLRHQLIHPTAKQLFPDFSLFALPLVCRYLLTRPNLIMNDIV